MTESPQTTETWPTTFGAVCTVVGGLMLFGGCLSYGGMSDLAQLHTAIPFGEGELSDAAGVLDLLEQYNSNSKTCWVAGFSFGAWVAMQLLMRRPEINRFVAISPQPNVYDFTFLSPCPASGIMIYGKKDELVPVEHLNELNKRLSSQKGIKVEFQSVKDANHFFKKSTADLSEALDKYIKKESALF